MGLTCVPYSDRKLYTVYKYVNSINLDLPHCNAQEIMVCAVQFKSYTEWPGCYLIADTNIVTIGCTHIQTCSYPMLFSCKS